MVKTINVNQIYLSLGEKEHAFTYRFTIIVEDMANRFKERVREIQNDLFEKYPACFVRFFTLHNVVHETTLGNTFFLNNCSEETLIYYHNKYDKAWLFQKVDLSALTGLNIIQAICEGETNPEKLVALRNCNCKKSEQEIAKALQTNVRKDYLFALKQEFETYNQLQIKVEKCDQEIKTMFDETINNDNNKKQHYIDKKAHKRINKNTSKNIDLNLLGYRYFEGVDLLKIEGLSHYLLLSEK